MAALYYVKVVSVEANCIYMRVYYIQDGIPDFVESKTFCLMLLRSYLEPDNPSVYENSIFAYYFPPYKAIDFDVLEKLSEEIILTAEIIDRKANTEPAMQNETDYTQNPDLLSYADYRICFVDKKWFAHIRLNYFWTSSAFDY